MTSWPAPKPDPWTTDPTAAEPIPEWQIQPEDEVPDDDEPVLEPYTQNLALQRLQQNAVKQAGPISKVAQLLCTLDQGS